MAWRIYKKGSNDELMFIGELAELNQLEGFVEVQVNTGTVKEPVSRISNNGDSIVLTSNNAIQGVQSSAYVAIRHDEGVTISSTYGMTRRIELLVNGVDRTIKKVVNNGNNASSISTYEMLDESMIATEEEVKAALGIS